VGGDPLNDASRGRLHVEDFAMRMASLVSLAAFLALSLLAFADPALAGNNNHVLPEPGTLGLLAAGAVGIAYLVRKRRK
jgi:hypothetical protein